MDATIKSTDELLNELENAGSFDRYAKNNSNSFLKRSLADELDRILREKQIKRAKLFADAELSEVYGYQIISGVRHPDRDKILQLLIAMELPLNEVQRLLKVGGYATLYAKNLRDSALIYAVEHRYTVLKTNEFLHEKGLSILG